MTFPRKLWPLLATPFVLISCASQPPVVAIAPPPVAAPARPLPPAEAYGAVAIPPLGPDGAYVTPNRGLTPDEVMWHVRAALNVAALGCRGEQAGSIIASYNALLKSQKATLAASDAATRVQYRKAYGAGWEARRDGDMTKLYNFFAQPGGQAGFCAAAATVAPQAAAATRAEFPAFAATALPALETPFTDFYRAYDAYRVDLAAWDRAYGPGSAGAAPHLDYASISDIDGWAAASASVTDDHRHTTLASR